MPAPKKLSLLSLAVAVPFCVYAAAHAQRYTARAIVFKNAPASFTQQQLETASGFHSGLAFTTADITAAAQKLADSGYFDNVSAAVTGPPNNLSVIFNLVPSNPAEFLPAGFSNFVWLTPTQIQSAIQSKLPLYNGTMAEAGNDADTAAAALTAALSALNVPGATFKVEHETLEPTLEYPERVLQFRVVAPRVLVSNIKLAGVSSDLAPFLQKSVNQTAHSAYNEGPAGRTTASLILAPLQDAGYAQANLTHVSLSIDAVADGAAGVVLTATPVAGPVYHVSALNFAGAPLYSPADFAKTAQLHPGDLASRKALIDTLAPLDAAYRSHGYLDNTVLAKPIFDAAAQTVSYTVTVTPGQPYTLHQVTAENLDPAAKADFDKYFNIHPGDPYSPAYVAGFVKNNTALSSLNPYTGSFKAYAHPATHTVDLDITFLRGSMHTNQTVTVH